MTLKWPHFICNFHKGDSNVLQELPAELHSYYGFVNLHVLWVESCLSKAIYWRPTSSPLVYEFVFDMVSVWTPIQYSWHYYRRGKLTWKDGLEYGNNGMKTQEENNLRKGLGMCCGLATNCPWKAHILKAVSPKEYSEIGRLDHDWATKALT